MRKKEGAIKRKDNLILLSPSDSRTTILYVNKDADIIAEVQERLEKIWKRIPFEYDFMSFPEEQNLRLVIVVSGHKIKIPKNRIVLPEDFVILTGISYIMSDPVLVIGKYMSAEKYFMGVVSNGKIYAVSDPLSASPDKNVILAFYNNMRNFFPSLEIFTVVLIGDVSFPEELTDLFDTTKVDYDDAKRNFRSPLNLSNPHSKNYRGLPIIDASKVIDFIREVGGKVITILLFVVLLNAGISYLKINESLYRRNLEIIRERKSRIEKELNELKNTIDKLKGWGEIAEKQKKVVEDWIPILDLIYDKSVQVSSVKYGSNEVKINIKVPSYREALKYTKKLAMSGYFSSVSLPELSTEPYVFSVTAKLGGGK